MHLITLTTTDEVRPGSGFQPWRLTTEMVDQMMAAGVINEDSPVELLDGVLFPMSPQNPLHSSLVSRCSSLLAGQLSSLATSSYLIRQQLPIAINTVSLPEPDLAVVRHRFDHYCNHHPTGADTLLVIEIADSTLKIDLGLKASLYAGAGIPEYWVVDALGSLIVCHRKPVDGAYREVKEWRSGALRASAAKPLKILIRDVFPSEAPNAKRSRG